MAIDNSYAQLQQTENLTVAKIMKASKGSYLAAMAMLTALVADKMTDGIMEKAKGLDTIAGQKKDAGPGGAGNLGENLLTAQLQADTQKLNMFVQAMNNAIKTFGEGNAKLAAKG